MKKTLISLVLITVLLFSLISCGKVSPAMHEAEYYSYDTSGDYYQYGVNEYDGGYEYEAAETASPAPAAEQKNDLQNRKMIKNANLSFQTTEFDEFMSQLNDNILLYNGYVESSNIYAGGISSRLYSRTADITARIPADNYDKFIGTVGTLGSLTNKSESSDDVTLSYVDVESRISALETEYNALLELLEKADSVEYIIEVRNRISDVQYQLESYKSRLRKYDDLVSYCTVRISVNEVRQETVSEDKLTFGERISSGLGSTFYTLGEDFQDFSVFLIVNLPFIIIWAIVILVIILIIKLIVKSSKKKKAKKAADKYVKSLDKETNEKK